MKTIATSNVVPPQPTLLDFILRRKRFVSDVLLSPLEAENKEEEKLPSSIEYHNDEWD